MKNTLKFLFKYGVIIALIFYLIQKGLISVQTTKQALTQWSCIIPASVILLLTALLGVIRWKLLLHTQNIQVPWAQTFQLTFIGYFFNIALPGAVSGDFVKGFYLGKWLHGEKTKAFGSILFDRISGLFALILVSAAAVFWNFSFFLKNPFLRSLQFLVLIGAFFVIFFYAYLFFLFPCWKEERDPFFTFFSFIEKKIPPLKILNQIYKSLREYYKHPVAVIRTLILSILIQLLVGLSFFFFAKALHVKDLSFSSFNFVVPLGLLVTTIPIAPAGVGTGNLAFLYLFGFFGLERGGDIFSLYALSQIGISCIGGFIYLYWKRKQRSQCPQGGDLR